MPLFDSSIKKFVRFNTIDQKVDRKWEQFVRSKDKRDGQRYNQAIMGKTMAELGVFLLCMVGIMPVYMVYFHYVTTTPFWTWFIYFLVINIGIGIGKSRILGK